MERRTRSGWGRSWAAGFLSVLAAAVLWSGCAREESGAVVAVVGGKAITAQEVRDLIARRLEKEREAGPADRVTEHLQTLVDAELLLLEAGEERIGDSPFYLRRMGRLRRDKLVGALEARRLPLTVGDDEVAQYIERKGYARAIRTADIMVPDRETAERVHRLIEEGADFADVARRWSINRETAAQGGDMGRFATRYQMVPALGDELFTLPVGSVSKPVPVGGYHAIFKVLAESFFEPTPQQRQLVAQELGRSKRQAARDSLVAVLGQEYGLERDQDGLAKFVETLASGAESPPDRVLHRYDGGEITAADVVQAARGIREDILAGVDDAGKLAAVVERWVVPDVLLIEAAVREGIEEEEEVSRWLAEMRRQTLITGLRGKILQQRAKVTDEDVREYFEANRGDFLHPEQIEVEEILVESESEAAELRRRIEAGADFGALAGSRSLRPPEIRDESGRFHVHRYESPRFGGLVEAVVDAEAGELTGPVEVEEGFTLFRILSRERRQETWEEARARATSKLRRQRQRQAFNEYMQELRERYDSQVEIRRDALEAAFGADPQSG
ncbi:MAG: peptidylprolyl isomerase [Gemmatimonadaceae bacterium]|nr:peptidylprolyl isomerase [Gemmatimonadaceae bacterium]